MTSKPSYFSRLPTEVLEIIIRYTSNQPRHEHWPSFIDVSTLYALLDYRVDLNTKVKNCMKSVTIVKDSDDDGYDNQILQPKVNSGSLFVPCDRSDLALLLHSLREISVCYGSTRAGNVQSTLEKLASEKFDQLRKIQILDRVDHGMLKKMLTSHGPKLEHLSVWLFSSIPTLKIISEHCSSIKELELAGLRENYKNLWRSVGPTLESLTVTFRRPIAPKSTINDIKIYCTKLKKIMIIGGNFHMRDETLVSLYTHYGCQLERANFKELLPASCFKILQKCSNVVCIAGNKRNLIDQMNVLGNRIRELVVQPSPPDSVEGLYKVSEKCMNIERISGFELFSWNIAHFEALFSRKRCSLREFHWNSGWPCMQGDNFFRTLLKLLSLRTGNLRSFSICLDATTGVLFADLAKNNIYLEKVHITYLGDEESGISTEKGIKISCETLWAFKACKNLKTLKVNHEGGAWYSRSMMGRSKSIENECVPYRKSNTFIRIGEQVYNG